MADDTPSEGPLKQPGPSPDTNAPPAASSTSSGCLVGCGVLLLFVAIGVLVFGGWLSRSMGSDPGWDVLILPVLIGLFSLAFFWMAQLRGRQ